MVGGVPFDVLTYTLDDNYISCYTGNSEGIISCSDSLTTYQYIAIRNLNNNSDLRFGEIKIFDEFSVDITSAQLFGLSTIDDASKLYSTTDGKKACPVFTITDLLDMRILFTLKYRANVVGLSVHVNAIANKID